MVKVWELFEYEFDDYLILAPPRNRQLKDTDYNLKDLVMSSVNKHVNGVISRKLRCSEEDCGAFVRHAGITPSQVKFPPFLFLHFLVEGEDSNLYNNFKDWCTLEQRLQIGDQHLDLVCGLFASQNHFFQFVKCLASSIKLTT